MKALFAAVAGLTFAGAASAVVVMDFQDLETPGTGLTDIGYYYSAGDYEIWHDTSEPFPFLSPQTGNTTFYQGSTAVLNDTVGGITHFQRIDGAPFDMESIDLAGLFVGGGDTTVTFTGHLSGGGTVMATFSTSNGGVGFQSFSFAGYGFTSVVDVTWSQDFVYHQFDNIAIVPAPASLALLGLGGLAIRRRR